MGSGRCTVCMASPILGVLPWVAGSLSRPVWTLPLSPLVQGEACFSWTSPVSWLWTWWVMTEGRPWMMSTGPSQSRIVVQDERDISGERGPPSTDTGCMRWFALLCSLDDVREDAGGGQDGSTADAADDDREVAKSAGAEQEDVLGGFQRPPDGRLREAAEAE